MVGLGWSGESHKMASWMFFGQWLLLMVVWVGSQGVMMLGT